MFFQAFQQEIGLNSGKLELVFRQGEALIEKSEPLDAAVIEEELEELQRYCHEVFGRVERYYKKLTRLPVSEDTHNKTHNKQLSYAVTQQSDLVNSWCSTQSDSFKKTLC